MSRLLHDQDFDWNKSLLFAKASHLSYRDPELISAITSQSWGFDRSETFDIDETQGFVMQDDSAVVVVFRGTMGVADWIRNLDLRRESRPYGMIHSGFSTAFEKVRDIVEAAADTARSNEKTLWLTGHSLGGAIAVVAAAELDFGDLLSGVYTFGQPRVGNGEAIAHLHEVTTGRHFRFVNDGDIVTRIPPLLSHSGHLLHFDRAGIPLTVSSMEGEADVGEPSLTIEEFEALQGQISTLEESIENTDAETEHLDFESSMEGLIPGIKDHAMERYIRCINQLADDPLSGTEGSNRTKTGFTGSLGEFSALESNLEVIDGSYPALVRVRSGNWSPPAGMVVNSKIGSIYSVQATKAQFLDLDSDPEIVSITASHDAGLEELAESVPFVGASTVHLPPISEKGDAALIGIVDTGLDVLHQTFQDDTGSTRIAVVWDQGDPNGPSPYDIDPASFSQKTGTVYLASDIDDMIGGTRPTPSRLRDASEHGTHVGSIAAGRQVGQCPGGLAPSALLACVIPQMKTESGAPPSLGYSNSHVDALAFLKSVAAGRNVIVQNERPIAINVSLGMNAGAHDGTSLLEAAFDGLTGGGRDPGCVIVKSAGNERGQAGHTVVEAGPMVMQAEWEATGFRFRDYFEAWYSFMDDLNFVLIDPSGNSTSTVNAQNPSLLTDLGGNQCQMQLTSSHKDNGDSLLAVQILPKAASLQEGRWKLEVTSNVLGSANNKVHIWVERDRDRAIRFAIDVPETTLSIPGTADTVIAVGATNSDDPGRLTDSSSYGATRKMGPKPELCAPGTEIVAAKANTTVHDAVVTKTGTSMAAPHVTGAIALAFSKRSKNTDKPQLSANMIRSLLIASAKGFSGRHHIGSGYGRLDVKAFIDRI